jgi:hypothetical protein
LFHTIFLDFEVLTLPIATAMTYLVLLLRVLAITALAFTLVSGRPSKLPRSPGNPTTDPFYQPPAGFESEEPGTILRQRTITAAFFGLIPDPVEAYQLLYRTTAINGSAIATVTTIFKPWIANLDRFVSYQTPYDASAPSCDPSYSYEIGHLPTNLVSSADLILIQAYLLSGYIVASPDYEGPDAAWGAGRLSGMGVLDGMRAVSNFKDTLGFSTSNPMIVGTGYSGGALATGWAASLQPSYAPELAIKGWVQGGTPANLTAELIFLDGSIVSGFLPAALDGIAKPSAYGAEFGPLLTSIVTPFGQSKLDFANSHCTIAVVLNFLYQSILSTDFQSLGTGLLYNPIVSSVLGQNSMGVYKNETPTAPVLLYHASQDEIVSYAPDLKLAGCGVTLAPTSPSSLLEWAGTSLPISSASRMP